MCNKPTTSPVSTGLSMHAASHKFAAPVIWHGYLISFIEAKYLKQWVDREGMLRLFFHDIWFIHMIVTWDGEVKILDALKSQFILYKLVKLNSQENNRHRFGNCSCLPCAGCMAFFFLSFAVGLCFHIFLFHGMNLASYTLFWYYLDTCHLFSQHCPLYSSSWLELLFQH